MGSKFKTYLKLGEISVYTTFPCKHRETLERSELSKISLVWLGILILASFLWHLISPLRIVVDRRLSEIESDSIEIISVSIRFNHFRFINEKVPVTGNISATPCTHPTYGTYPRHARGCTWTRICPRVHMHRLRSSHVTKGLRSRDGNYLEANSQLNETI